MPDRAASGVDSRQDSTKTEECRQAVRQSVSQSGSDL